MEDSTFWVMNDSCLSIFCVLPVLCLVGIDSHGL